MVKRDWKWKGTVIKIKIIINIKKLEIKLLEANKKKSIEFSIKKYLLYFSVTHMLGVRAKFEFVRIWFFISKK